MADFNNSPFASMNPNRPTGSSTHPSGFIPGGFGSNPLGSGSPNGNPTFSGNAGNTDPSNN